MHLQVSERCAEPAFVVREHPVVELVPGAVESDRVVFTLADVESDEHVDLVVILDLCDHCISVRSG